MKGDHGQLGSRGADRSVLACHGGHKGGVQVVLLDGAAAAPGGPDGGVVHQALQRRAAEAHGVRGQAAQIDVFSQGLVPAVQPENVQALPSVGQAHLDLRVEAARPGESRVQDVRPVGGGQHDDAAVLAEAGHLAEQGVEGAVALVAARAVVPPLADGVDLIDEDDAAPGLGGPGEQLPHPRRAHAHIHFQKIRPAERIERHARLSSQRPGHEGLAGAGRAVEQHAPGQARSQSGVFPRMGQIVGQGAQAIHGDRIGGHVPKGDRRAGDFRAPRPGETGLGAVQARQTGKQLAFHGQTPPC